MTMIALLAVLSAPAELAAAGGRLLPTDRPAAERCYRAALARRPDHHVNLTARHGLAVCLLAADPPGWKEATDLLHAPAHDGGYPDRGAALELLGYGYREKAKAEGDPRRWDAARWFGEATQWFEQRKRPADAARCRCSHAEIDLLLNRPHDARAKTEVFLKDRGTPSGGRGLHLLALACLKLNDPATAERAAGRVPADDPAFADAQAVLAAVRLRAGDRTEAESLYRAAGDRFQLACLAFDAGRLDEALDGFAQLPGDDAAVWAGAALVRLGRFAEAVTRLEALHPTTAHLPDQVARWLGEARLGTNAPDAVATLRRAVELVEKVPDHLDPAARERRHDHRFALADALLRTGSPKDAADLFQRVWNEGGRPKRREELLARLALSHHRAKQPDMADHRADEYRRLFPTGPHLRELALLQAETATAKALAVGPEPPRNHERREKVARAVERCEVPELADDPAARVLLATVLRWAGKFVEAAAAVRDVPAARGLRGDCLLRAGDPAAAVELLAGVDELGHALALKLLGRPTVVVLPGADDSPDGMLLAAYQGGLKLLSEGKPADARAAFEALVSQTRGYPTGAAVLRRAAEARLAAAATRDATREAAEEAVRRAEELRGEPGAEAVRPHLYLLAARTFHKLAAEEVKRAWEQERKHRRHQWAEHGLGDPPTVGRSDVPVQWMERRATDVYRRLVEELPQSPHAAVARREAAAVHAGRGDHRQAAAVLADAEPAALADALVAAGDPEAALLAVERADDPAAVDRRVGLQVVLGRPAEGGVGLRRGEALAAAGRLVEAAAEFAKHAGPDARYGAGWVAARRGRLDEAADHLTAAGTPRARLLLGLVRASQGRRDEAVGVLLAVRTGDATEWAARLAAARLLGDRDMLRRLFDDVTPDAEWMEAVLGS